MGTSAILCFKYLSNESRGRPESPSSYKLVVAALRDIEICKIHKKMYILGYVSFQSLGILYCCDTW